MKHTLDGFNKQIGSSNNSKEKPNHFNELDVLSWGIYFPEAYINFSLI